MLCRSAIQVVQGLRLTIRGVSSNIIHVNDMRTLDTPPLTGVQKADVREQLKRIIDSEFFRASRRCCSFLEYSVNYVLEGRPIDELKERTVGVEVFSKLADYDTGQDNVVRVTANEVRKRLAQYYTNEQHAEVPEIHLQAGSYAVYFQWANSPSVVVKSENNHKSGPNLPPQEVLPLKEGGLNAVNQVIDFQAGKTKPHSRPSIVAVFSAITTLLFLVLVGMGYKAYTNAKERALLDFWSPVLKSDSNAMLLIAHSQAPQANNASTLGAIMDEPSSLVAVRDALASSHICALVSSQKGSCAMGSASEASISQLRSGPVVLIGLFSNLWSIRLQKSLPFQFSWSNNPDQIVTESPYEQMTDAFVIDVKNSKILGHIQTRSPLKTISNDYGLLARFHSDVTGKPVILLGGITALGTEGISEFATNQASMADLERMAPSGKMSANVEAVIETEIIDGKPGQSKVVSAKFW